MRKAGKKINKPAADALAWCVELGIRRMVQFLNAGGPAFHDVAEWHPRMRASADTTLGVRGGSRIWPTTFAGV